ncbi:MAG: SPOR domain-containing protein [Burkholderiales bacterium]|jgi:DedD protein
MATAIRDEELQLKKRARRRLVGAIALVLLIVVFLPMVLDSEPKPLNQDIAISIPPIPKADVPAPTPSVAVTPPTGARPHIAGLPEGNPPNADNALVPDSKNIPSANETPKAEVRAPAKGAHKREAKLVAAAQSTEDSFVVQLGAFSNAANARALQKKLQDNKFKSYSELIKNPGGDRTRVRVGPYPTREAAEKARDRLKSLKLVIGDASVVRLD